MRFTVRLLSIPLILAALCVITILSLSPTIAASDSIDSFETSQTSLTLTLTGTTTTSSTAPASPPGTGILGGERDIIIQRTGPAGPTLEAGVSGGVFFYGHSPGVTTGFAQIQWDGADGDPNNLDTTGLGGVDLTVGGSQDSFILSISNDLATTVTIEVFTGSGTATFSLDLPDFQFTLQDYTIPFSSFSGGGDFTDVGAVTITINSNTPLDLQIDTFGTTGPPPTATPTATPTPEEEDEEEISTPRSRVEAPTASASGGGGGGGGGATPPAVGTPAALDFPIMLPETGEFPPINQWSFNPWPVIITGLVLAMAVGVWLNAKHNKEAN